MLLFVNSQAISIIKHVHTNFPTKFAIEFPMFPEHTVLPFFTHTKLQLNPQENFLIRDNPIKLYQTIQNCTVFAFCIWAF